jgi:hypothetical protein
MTLSEDQQRALVAQREREAIAVELAWLRRDAARYRWLRKGDLESMRVIGLPQSDSQYDRELDAEMEGKHHA